MTDSNRHLTTPRPATSCKKIRRDLSLLAGRDLTNSDRIDAVQEHLAHCPACRAKYRSMRNGLKALSAATLPGSVTGHETWQAESQSLWPELSEKLAARSPAANSSRPWTARLKHWPPVVAVMAACGVMAVVLTGPVGNGPAHATVDTQPVNDVAPEHDLAPAQRPIDPDRVMKADAGGLFPLDHLIPSDDRK